MKFASLREDIANNSLYILYFIIGGYNNYPIRHSQKFCTNVCKLNLRNFKF
ncbi:hypothetical protein C723_0019 [Christiangramia flava JLT2011]|uniref:Uncharacterized protein n=1 Tax=Christiangramia flava JLT2011 TaxID=1229726 RepID=A0A1L7I5Z5_9FLAO|nr:hypothetical protein GRFL_1879 [Christiangramia flava JLT2011]OSS40610.1 hypothetical protein C723_0019 [Christiangramia flava JLT2011]